MPGSCHRPVARSTLEVRLLLEREHHFGSHARCWHVLRCLCEVRERVWCSGHTTKRTRGTCGYRPSKSSYVDDASFFLLSADKPKRAGAYRLSSFGQRAIMNNPHPPRIVSHKVENCSFMLNTLV